MPPPPMPMVWTTVDDSWMAWPGLQAIEFMSFGRRGRLGRLSFFWRKEKEASPVMDAGSPKVSKGRGEGKEAGRSSGRRGRPEAGE